MLSTALTIAFFSLWLIPQSISVPTVLDKRYVILADGTSMQYGTISNGSLSGLQWQASGILAHGGCKYANDQISDCYELYVTDDPDGMLETGSPSGNRQRIEFLTPGAADGTIWHYNYKYQLANGTGSSTHFFHLMQIFGRGEGDPIITFDAVNNLAAIEDDIRTCGSSGCSHISLSTFEGHTWVFDIYVQYGANGKFKGTVSNLATGKAGPTYSATGEMGEDSSSLKFGLYRLTTDDQTEARAFVGDFSSTQLSKWPSS